MHDMGTIDNDGYGKLYRNEATVDSVPSTRLISLPSIHSSVLLLVLTGRLAGRGANQGSTGRT